MFKGNVRMTGSVASTSRAAEATYTERDGVITIPGEVQFTKGRMTGSGLGATYDQNREVLWILSQAKINVTPDKAGQGGLNAVANKAGLARAEHYIVLDGAARIEGEGRVTEANVVTIRLTPDDERVQLLELRGNSRITGGTGGPQSMAARDIDLTYGPDGKTLQFAKLIEGAVLQLPGTGPGAAGKRIAGDTIDMTLAPDGSTVTNLNSNGRVQVDLPGGKRRPGQADQVGDDDCGGRSRRRSAECAVRRWRRVSRDTRRGQGCRGPRSHGTIAEAVARHQAGSRRSREGRLPRQRDLHGRSGFQGGRATGRVLHRRRSPRPDAGRRASRARVRA